MSSRVEGAASTNARGAPDRSSGSTSAARRIPGWRARRGSTPSREDRDRRGRGGGESGRRRWGGGWRRGRAPPRSRRASLHRGWRRRRSRAGSRSGPRR